MGGGSLLRQAEEHGLAMMFGVRGAFDTAICSSDTGGGYTFVTWAPQTDRRRGMTETPTQRGYIERKDDYARRLRRIEGQARGLQRMVEEEKYCIDILTQIAAITKALQSVALGLLDEHVRRCVVEAASADGSEVEVKLREASDAIARLVRS
jgi:DNA-binding FrmR family transcriptional regulator